MYDLGIEIVEEDWLVLDIGWSVYKARKNKVTDYSRLFNSGKKVHHNPGIILRSDSEVVDYDEGCRYLDAELPRVKNAGYKRIYFETSNEINNAGYDLERWKQEGPSLVQQWLKLQREYPEVDFISPGMMPMFSWEASQWHFPTFSQFKYIGQHTYHLNGNFFWSPWNLRSLFPTKDILVTEFNNTSTINRVPSNLVMLDTLKTMEYVQGVVFFCAGQWQGYGLQLEESLQYKDWYLKNKEEELPKYDPQLIFDDWVRDPFLPGEGYNEDDLFNVYLNTYQVVAEKMGVPKGGPDRIYGKYLVRFYVGGIMLVPNNDWDINKVRIAFTPKQMPPN